MSMGFAAMSTLLVATATKGDVIRYEYAGTVSLIFGGSFYGITPEVGDPITGTFTYDTSIVGTQDGPYATIYEDPQSSQLGLTLRGITVTSDTGYRMEVYNNAPVVDFQIVNSDSRVNVGGSGVHAGSIQFEFLDPTGRAFGGQSVPTHLDLSSFTVTQGELNNLGESGLFSGVVFSIDSLTVVPEPSTFTLVAIGSIGLVVWSRRYKNRRLTGVL